jgi:hypothetical protein
VLIYEITPEPTNSSPIFQATFEIKRRKPSGLQVIII